MLKRENKARIIFHIDMNAFFCSVACILNPTLRGKAFAIGRENTTKGVISTASYEARKFGIHSAMPLIEAYHIKKDLIVVNPDFKYYKDYHNKFVHLVKGYTKSIEVASIDEVYADMTEACLDKHPIVLAKEIQMRLLKEFDLPCSIGIAPTLFLAKMASDIEKPLGVVIIRKRDSLQKLGPLSVSDIYGIGKKTYPILIDNGIKTIAEFMDSNNKDLIISLVGENTYNYAFNAISGNSSNIIDPNRYSESSSISTSQTYDNYKTEESDILLEMRKMTRELVNKINKNKYYTKTVGITLRDSDFKTITRQTSLENYTNDFYDIMNFVTNLLEDNFTPGKSYRLVGVQLQNLVKESELPKEYNLFTIPDCVTKEENINKLIREFQDKYGNNSLYLGKKKE